MLKVNLLFITFLCAASAFAQSSSESLELNILTSPSTSEVFLSRGATVWILALIGFLLFGIMFATLWPNDSVSNPYQRQRKFSRVDQLFFKVQGHVLSEDESRAFLKDTSDTSVAQLKKQEPAEQLVLLGLSFSGCSFLGDERLKKGRVVLLNLDTLPDFPSKELIAAVKVVWVREEKTHGKKYWVAGGKFIYSSSQDTPENLRQYMNYLMNEPAT